MVFARILARGFGALTLAALAPRVSMATEASFSAPIECASAEEFLQLVRERLPPGVNKVPDFRANVAGELHRFTGELAINQAAPRYLQGESCVEILDGMAIILALRAERLRDEEQKHSSGQPKQTGEPTPTRLTRILSAPLPVSELRREGGAPPPTATDHHQGAKTLGYRIGVGGAALPNVAPVTSMGPLVFAAIEGASAETWTLRLGLERTVTGTSITGPASTWARLSVARLTGCVLEAVYGNLHLRPCAQAAGGIFEAGALPGGPITSVSEIQRPWFAVGPSLRAEWPLTKHLAIAGEAAALVSLVHQELAFRVPDETIYESGLISPYFGVTAEFLLGGSKLKRAGIAR